MLRLLLLLRARAAVRGLGVVPLVRLRAAVLRRLLLLRARAAVPLGVVALVRLRPAVARTVVLALRLRPVVHRRLLVRAVAVVVLLLRAVPRVVLVQRALAIVVVVLRALAIVVARSLGIVTVAQGLLAAVPRPILRVPGAILRVPRPVAAVPGAISAVPGLAAVVPGALLVVPRAVLAVPGARPRVPAEVPAVPRTIVEVPRAVLPVPRAIAPVPRPVARVPGAVARVPRAVLPVPGLVALVPGAVAVVPGLVARVPRPAALVPRAVDVVHRRGIALVRHVALVHRRRWQRRRQNRRRHDDLRRLHGDDAALEDVDVSGERRLVAVGADRPATRVEGDVGIDHVGGLRPIGGRHWPRGRRHGIGRLRPELLQEALGRALQAVDETGVLQNARRGIEAGAARRAEVVAGRPDEAVLPRQILDAGIGVAVAEVAAATGAGAQPRRTVVLALVEADIVAPGGQPDAIVAEFVAQHPRFVRAGEGVLGTEAEIAHAAALGEQHDAAVAAGGELDVGHRAAVLRHRSGAGVVTEEGRHEELAPHARRVEAAACVEPHRPDAVVLLVVDALPLGIAEAVAAPHRVEQPALAAVRTRPDRETPDAAAEIGEVPARRRPFERPGGTITDPRGAGAVEGDRRQRQRLAGLRVEEAPPPLDAVVVAAELAAVLRRQAVDHAGLEVGDVELPRLRVVGDVTERRAGVAAAVQRDLGEVLRHVAGVGRQPVDRARAGLRPPHPGHPVARAGLEVQAVGGGRRHEDVGLRRVVDGDAEDLADVGRRRRRPLRHRQHVLADRRLADGAQVEDAADDAVEIDRREAATRPLPRHRAGEAGVVGLARLQRRTARLGCRRPLRGRLGRRRTIVRRWRAGGVVVRRRRWFVEAGARVDVVWRRRRRDIVRGRRRRVRRRIGRGVGCGGAARRPLRHRGGHGADREGRCREQRQHQGQRSAQGRPCRRSHGGRLRPRPRGGREVARHRRSSRDGRRSAKW